MNVLCATASYTPPATGRRSVRAAAFAAGVITVIAAGEPPEAGAAGRASAVTVASRIDNRLNIGPSCILRVVRHSAGEPDTKKAFTYVDGIRYGGQAGTAGRRSAGAPAGRAPPPRAVPPPPGSWGRGTVPPGRPLTSRRPPPT